jgi:hypothetical protein
MKISKAILISAFALIVFISIGAVRVSAQEREKRGDRPIVIYYYDPFWSWNRWQYDSYDPYFYDPYLRERRQVYYLREEVRDARSDLKEHMDEYNSDGIITADERRELNEDYGDLNEALNDLEEYYDES